MNLAGQIVGSYHIFDEIGRGRLGTVYRAYEPSMDRYVAIKVLAPELFEEPALVERVRHQAEVAAKLHHPNILGVYCTGQENDLCYIVMEYRQDDTLGEVVEREGRLSLSQAMPIVEQLAAALDHAHQRGVIHGDVKPANIYVGEESVKLGDFGLAMAAGGAGIEGVAAAGNPEYMAPEQARGEEIDYRADLYSLGVVTYEMLTGRRPAVGLDLSPDPSAGLPSEAIPADPPLHSGLPRPLERVLEKALARSPEERWISGGAMVGALRQVLASRESRLREQPLRLAAEPIYKEVMPELLPPARPRSRWLRPPLVWVVLLGVLLVLGLAFLGVVLALGSGA
jgi:serine/threonine-protein kinase